MNNYEFKNPDLHIHSHFSDGSDSAEELLGKVKAAGIDIFALTDHDCYDGCEAMREILRPEDPYFIPGIELSCEDDLGKYHILGYCYDVNKTSIREAAAMAHDSRMLKTRNRFLFLEELGYTFSEEEKQETYARTNPGKPHFVELLMRNGYAKERAEGFEILGRYKGEEPILTPEMAVEAILQADGIPVLAHGILAQGGKNLSEEKITERVDRLKGYGLMGLECFYSTYTPEQKRIMLDLAKKYNLMVTAGSDYHGRNKTVKLGQTNDPDPALMARFYKAVRMLLD